MCWSRTRVRFRSRIVIGCREGHGGRQAGATSAAKLGPDKIAGIALGAASAMISVMNFWVPRSIPLAQAMSGVRGAIDGARRERHSHGLRRHHQQDRVSARGPREVARHRNDILKLHAGQNRLSRWRASVRHCRRSCSHSVTLRPARAQICASAVPQAPPPSTEIVCRVMVAPFTCTPPCVLARPPRCDLVERPARARCDVERIGEPQCQALGACPGDHGAVVGA